MNYLNHLTIFESLRCSLEKEWRAASPANNVEGVRQAFATQLWEVRARGSREMGLPPRQMSVDQDQSYC